MGIGCIFALAAIPWVQQQYRIDQLDRQLNILVPEQQSRAALNRQLAGLQDRHLIAAEIRKNGDALRLLAALTYALPNGTWLRGLTLTPNQIMLSGQSTDAARLISALSSIPAFRNPSFIGPMIRAADGSTSFVIQAWLAK
jgi:Tfp pilus assembly protein PilN